MGANPQLLNSLLLKAPTCPLPLSRPRQDPDQRPGSAWVHTNQGRPTGSDCYGNMKTKFSCLQGWQTIQGTSCSRTPLESWWGWHFWNYARPQLASLFSLSCALNPTLASPGSTSLTNHWPRNLHLRTWSWRFWSQTTSGIGTKYKTRYIKCSKIWKVEPQRMSKQWGTIKNKQVYLEKKYKELLKWKFNYWNKLIG